MVAMTLNTWQQPLAVSDITLLLPAADVLNPEFSIVIPALNEEITIERFVNWCKEGIAAAGIEAEILIIDSSTDRTAEIAVAAGARVLKTPKRGLGRAYIDAIPHIRGRYILMGDADCTYDFRDIRPFVDQFQAGAEFIMGSRFEGSIEDGAMPLLHRYFGTPLTTWILNRMFGTHFSDIHCGMRGITLDGLKRIRLASQSWEYASEMVLKSVHHGLVTREVPVRFMKDLEGRMSHHARAGWFSPWRAGWINLKAMFVFGADFFLMAPGFALLFLGLLPLCLLSLGPVTVGSVTLSLNAMLLSLFVAVVGLQLFLIGVIAQSLYDGTGHKRRRWLAAFAYNRTFVAAAAVFMVGTIPVIRFLVAFIDQDNRFTDTLIDLNHQAIFGLFLMMCGILVFVSMLVIQAIGLYASANGARKA
jgi:glycosyltransferase involved in cell wall biosynthesis